MSRKWEPIIYKVMIFQTQQDTNRKKGDRGRKQATKDKDKDDDKDDKPAHE